MEYPPLAKQLDQYSRTLAFFKGCPPFAQQSFDVTPRNIATHRMGKDQFKGFLVLAFHEVNGTLFPPCPEIQTSRQYYGQDSRAPGNASLPQGSALKHRSNLFLHHFCGLTGIGGIADGAANDDVIGSVTERLLDRDDPLLVIGGAVFHRADTG